MTYKIEIKDLNILVSNSKDKFFHLNTPLFVSGKEVERGFLNSVANFESLLMFLNGNGLLKEFVEINYTGPVIDDCDIPELEEKKK